MSVSTLSVFGAKTQINSFSVRDCAICTLQMQ
jgi:hypothetical protein